MKYTNGIFGNDKRETMSKYGNNDRDDPVPEERGSRFRLPVIAWLSVLFFAACTKMSPEDGVARHDGTLVRLTVSLPQPALPTKGARAGSLSGDAENRIEDVMILVLEQENGKYVYRYMTEGERLESTGSGTQFQAKLLSTSKPVKLMLAGNYGDAFAAYAPSPSHSEAEVKAGIGCSFTGAAQSLPMYGEIAVPSGLEADRENRFSVKMLRAVARIDVEKDLTADSRPLRIESVRLYRPNDKIQLAPDESFAPESPQGHRAVGIRGRGEIPVPGRNGDERAGPCFDCRNLCPRGRRSGRCGGTADGSDLHRRGGILRRTVPAYLLPGGFRSGPRGPSVRPDTEKLQVRFPDQKGNRPGVERSRSGRREQGDEHRRGDRAVGGLYDRDAFRGRQLYRLVVP